MNDATGWNREEDYEYLDEKWEMATAKEEDPVDILEKEFILLKKRVDKIADMLVKHLTEFKDNSKCSF
jgi:hypothetical protein